jgi:hypothetical protein
MQGPAAANAKSATPFTTAGRVEQVGTWMAAVGPRLTTRAVYRVFG